MDADEAKKCVDIVLREDVGEVVVDYGRIGTGCVESRHLRLINPSSSSVDFQLRRDPHSHPLGDTFKVCPAYGEIPRGGSFKVTVKYRPRFPHVKDIDYFSIMYSNTSCVQLRFEGVSLAPTLTVSRSILDFGVPIPRSESSRSFVLTNDGGVPAAFSFPFSSTQFSVSPIGGLVSPGERVRVSVRSWTDRRRPSRRVLPILVHNGASHQVQLLAGTPPYEIPAPPMDLFKMCPTSPSYGPIVIDVDRVDFGITSLIDGEVRVIHASNVTKKSVRVEWIADRNDVFSVQPATALIKPETTAMFEVLFLPDIREYVYWGHVEALLTVDADGSEAGDEERQANDRLSLPTLGHTFPLGAETWVPRVQLVSSPLVMAPCAVAGLVSGTFIIRNLDNAKPVVYDLSSVEGGVVVRPVAGCVSAGALHVVTVQHTASTVELAVLQLQLVWRLNLQQAHAVELQLKLSQEVPAVAWSPASLHLPHACPGMLVKQPADVRNLTRCRLRLRAQPTDVALWTDAADVTLAPNQSRRVNWTCRPEMCGTSEFVIPHKLQLMSACDLPLGEERVQNLKLIIRAVEEALSCEPHCVQLGERALGSPATGCVLLTNWCASTVTLVLALWPRPLEMVPSGAASILLSSESVESSPKAAVRRMTIPAGDSVDLALSLCPDMAGRYHYDLTYRLLSEECDGREISEPRALAELTLTAQHPHVRVADLEAVCGERFEDKPLLWRLLAIDRLNAALADTGEPSRPLCMVFPPRPMGAPPLNAVFLLENPCSVRVSWLFEPGFEADGSHADHPAWLQLTPRRGVLEAEAKQTVSVCVGALPAAGLLCARLRVSVLGGQCLPVTVVATAVPAGLGWVYTASDPPCPGLLLPGDGPDRPPALHSALSHDSPQQLQLQPVPVGCRVPPVQYCPLYNGGLQPVNYHVHTEHLDALCAENYGVPVIRCLDTEGVVPAGGCTRIRLVFDPLEVGDYSALLPVCVSAPCCHQPLLLVARGAPPGAQCEPLTPNLPDRQLAVMPDQLVRLSHRYIHFGSICINTERSRLVYLHNISSDVLRFAWTRRLAGDDCCAIYGDASASGGESANGPSIRPEPAEGVLGAGEVLAVRVTLTAGQVAQVYSHTVHLAFRNLTRERLFALNHAAWEAQCRRREAEFVIDESHPEGARQPPSPPPQEPAVVYMTVTLSALVQHADDTPMSGDMSWRERMFVPLMCAPSVTVPETPSQVPSEDVSRVQRLLSGVLWQLLRDCEMQTALKRLRKDAVPLFSQLVPEPGGQERRFHRPRRAQQPRLIERCLQSVLFNLMREACRGELQLGQDLDTALPVQTTTEHGQVEAEALGELQLGQGLGTALPVQTTEHVEAEADGSGDTTTAAAPAKKHSVAKA